MEKIVDPHILEFYKKMSAYGLPGHKYSMYTLEEAYQEFSNHKKINAILIPNALLLAEHRPQDIYDATPHHGIPSLRSIDVAFMSQENKKILSFLKQKLLKDDVGEKLFEELFSELKFTRSEQILNAARHLEKVASCLKKGLLHPLLIYYLGILTNSIGSSESRNRKESSKNRADKIRYSIKCFELFLQHSREYQKELQQQKSGDDLIKGYTHIQKFIFRYNKRFPIKDEIPNYKDLESGRKSTRVTLSLNYIIRFMQRSYQYFYFEGMIHCAHLLILKKMKVFDKTKPTGPDPTGYETLANILYLMALAYTHPKTDKKKIISGTQFYKKIKGFPPVDLNESVLHLSLAKCAYQLEKMKYKLFAQKLATSKQKDTLLSRIILKGLAEKSFRFELLKYDFYETLLSNRRFPMSFSHIKSMKNTYPTEYKQEYFEFLEKVYQSTDSTEKAHEISSLLKGKSRREDRATQSKPIQLPQGGLDGEKQSPPMPEPDPLARNEENKMSNQNEGEVSEKAPPSETSS